MRLVSEPTDVAKRVGWDPMTALLAPRIHVDGPGMMTPMILEGGHSAAMLLAREQEKGNIAAAGTPTIEVQYFDPYFTVESAANGTSVPRRLVDLVASIGNERLVVGPDLPFARSVELSTIFEVALAEPGLGRQAVAVHRVRCADVETRFRTWRAQCCSRASAVIDDGRPALDGLKRMLGADLDTRYSDLGDVLVATGVSAVLVGSPVNLQELIGWPLTAGDWAAIWVAGSDEVLLLGPGGAPCPVERSTPKEQYASLADAVRSITGTASLGIEESWLSSGRARELQERGLELVPATTALARWREERDVQDLAASIVVAAASQHAIESTIAETRTRLDAGETIDEREVAGRYLSSATTFARRYQLPGLIAEFFTNCHAGNRTIYPSIPTRFPLTQNTRTLKVDAGLRWSIGGVTMATSDVGRTLTRSADATAAYAAFTDIVRSDVIGRLRPGVLCPDPHRWCVDGLDALVPSLVSWKLLPSGVAVRPGYARRNIGHLMGKQESFVTEFRPANPYVLRAGDIGAAEIQWPYAGHAIATEDMWVIADDTTYMISGA